MDRLAEDACHVTPVDFLSFSLYNIDPFMTSKTLHFYGSHGTSKSRAALILRQGFCASKGRHGTGIYFWSRDEHDHQKLGTKKALAWADMCRAEGRYERDVDDSSRCISSKITVDESFFLDIRSESSTRMFEAFVHRCAEVLKGLKVKGKAGLGAAVVDAFVADLEKIRSAKFHALHDQTELPPSYKEALKQRLGYTDSQMRMLRLYEAGCYVVRNVDCLGGQQEDTV